MINMSAHDPIILGRLHQLQCRVSRRHPHSRHEVLTEVLTSEGEILRSLSHAHIVAVHSVRRVDSSRRHAARCMLLELEPLLGAALLDGANEAMMHHGLVMTESWVRKVCRCHMLHAASLGL
jgi:protein gp37